MEEPWPIPPTVPMTATAGTSDPAFLELLNDARLLSLATLPTSAAAVGLTETLAAIVRAWEVKAAPKNRAASGMAKLEAAVGTVVGSLLANWSGAALSYRSGSKAAFDVGAATTYEQLRPVIAGLVALGFIGRHAGVRYGTDLGDSQTYYRGKAARYWPLPPLLTLAVSHGLSPATLAKDVVVVPSKVPPKVTAPVMVRELRDRAKARRGRERGAPLHASRLGGALEAVRKDVESANAYAGTQSVSGCLPPRWYRVFGPDVMLGGRWIAGGVEGTYQSMKARDRAAIRIDGESVAEVDVAASHLTLMLGLLGLPLPEGDPYELPAIPRAAVKAWVTQTLGKGSAVTRPWSAPALKRLPELARYAPREVGAAVIARFAFLRAPGTAVVLAAGLDRLALHGTPARLLTNRLMALEANALTLAMGRLRAADTFAMPLHDALLGRRSAVPTAQRELAAAFLSVAGIIPRMVVSEPAG